MDQSSNKTILNQVRMILTVLTLVYVVFAIGHTVEAYARLCGYFDFTQYATWHMLPNSKV